MDVESESVVDMDARAAQHVRRVRVCWVHVSGAGNMMVGLEHACWGHSERARGRAVQMCESHSASSLGIISSYNTYWENVNHGRYCLAATCWCLVCRLAWWGRGPNDGGSTDKGGWHRRGGAGTP